MSDAELRIKAGKTMVALCGCRAVGNVPEATAQVRQQAAQAPAQVLPDLQRKGLEHREALRMT